MDTPSPEPVRPGRAPGCPPGSRFPLVAGVRSRMVRTARLEQHVYEAGSPTDEPVVLVHGNASSARFFEDLLASLPGYYVIAPDMRGYGASEAATVDATRGVRDFSDDVHALVEVLGLRAFHLLGWSLGGNIAMQYCIDHPDRVRTLTLHATGSPYGYGGTHGPQGTPNYADFAGSGGGLISPEVTARLVARDFTANSPFTQRSALRQIIVKPTCTLDPVREDTLVEQMLMIQVGERFYPGDAVPSANWPFTGPGVCGANNALSPKYLDQAELAQVWPQPPVLWIRGADDHLVSDAAHVDPATLGQLGVIPGWPGIDVCPPQPMIAQIRAVLDSYRQHGGIYHEVVLDDCAHAPLLEHPDTFRRHFRQLLREHAMR